MTLKYKMIGTNSVEESSAEILYPSISVCSGRKYSIKPEEYPPGFHISSNLSELIIGLQLWQRNETGQLQKTVIDPMVGNLENRDNQCYTLFSILSVLPSGASFLVKSHKVRC